MLGSKLSLMFWDLPKEDTYKWGVTITPRGQVTISFHDPVLLEGGAFTFDEDSTLTSIEAVMKRLGFTERAR